MGNLFTHIDKAGRKQLNKRILILSKLKRAWGAKKRDYAYIHELQKELEQFDGRKRKDKSDRKPNENKKAKSLFNGYYNPKPVKYKGMFY